MTKKIERIWVDQEFAKQIKIDAATVNSSILEYTRKKAEEKKQRGLFRIEL